MPKMDVSKRDRCRCEVFVESITHIMNLLVDLEQIQIFYYSLLNQCNSAECGVDVIVADYCCEEGEDICKEDLSLVHIVVVA